MAETIRGTAVFWGIGSSFVAAGTGMGGTGATLNPQSIDFDVMADVDVKVADYKGETVARVFADLKQTLKIDVIPTADTLAHVKAASILPAPGEVITITDTADTEVSGTQSGKYLFIRGSKQRSNTDVVKLTFELEQYVANDVTTAVT